VAMFPFSDVVRATIFDILLGEACPKQVVLFLVYNKDDESLWSCNHCKRN